MTMSLGHFTRLLLPTLQKPKPRDLDHLRRTRELSHPLLDSGNCDANDSDMMVMVMVSMMNMMVVLVIGIVLMVMIVTM